MNTFDHLTSNRVTGPSVSGWRRILGALCVVIVLGSCGRSAMAPDVSDDAGSSLRSATGSGAVAVGTDEGAGNAGHGGLATEFRGTPSAQFAFSTSDLTLIEQTTGTSGWVTILAGKMKTPSSKEIYVSASIEAGLYTQTLVRSKNLKKDTSTASVAIQVRTLIDGTPMPPGTVTYAARTQTLSATLEGAIAGCLTIVTNPDGTQSIILDPDCVTPEEIELILNTLNAASFNFVASNVPVGTHTISLQARISSTTSVDTGTASAKALVGKGTMIAQIVRAVR
jgi:hypothetical protein